jgi:4-hydroxy-2-oxoheptanedioate aldolase
MKNLRERVLRGEGTVGCFLNLGSSLTAEIVGRSGFDWVVIDLEHGAGSEGDVLHQLQALEHTDAAAIVRVESHERQRFHRVLDVGAHGIMVPRVNNAEDARRAVAAMRYQPGGERGVARMNRACGFGTAFDSYFAAADSSLLTVLQIETKLSLDNIDSIAAIDGVDVLFIGPVDLSRDLGIFGQFDHSLFLDAVRTTAQAAQRADKQAGIIIDGPANLSQYWDLGYRFVACSSDGSLLNSAARNLADALKSCKTQIAEPHGRLA